MIKLKIDTKEMLRAFTDMRDFRQKTIKGAFNSATRKSVALAKKTIKELYKKQVKNPLGTSYKKYFDDHMKIRFSKDVASGVSHLSGATISFSSKPRSLARYVKNKSVLKRHRKLASMQGFGGSLAPPLEFEIYKGKTTRLRRTFAARGMGSAASRLLVYRRGSGQGRALSSKNPRGITLAQFFRSKKNNKLEHHIQIRSLVKFKKEFDRFANFRIGKRAGVLGIVYSPD